MNTEQNLTKAREIVLDAYMDDHPSADRAEVQAELDTGVWDTAAPIKIALRALQSEQERQEGEIKRLREALEPFARACVEIESAYGSDLPDDQSQFPDLAMRDFRAARAALSEARP
jgi:hypothetical protein